jgi:hypothetical protein
VLIGGIAMKSEEDEVKRLQRLREQQLQARDPNAKKVAQYRRTVTNYQKRQKRMTVKSVISDLPAKFWFMLIGGLLGAVTALVLLILIQESWVKAVAWIVILFGLVSGRVMGAARDWGDEDWIKRR